MPYDLIFSSSSLLVMPFWVLMIFAGFWRWTPRIMRSLWVVVPAAVLYALLVLPDALNVFAQVSNPALGNIVALLGTPSGATISWVHFLAFDLFVGRWAYLDGHERGVPWWLVSVTLFFILMLGPMGLLMYLALRWGWSLRATPQPVTTAP